MLVFVTCSQARLEHEWSRSRLQDWLGGMVVLRRVARGAGAADPLEVDPDAQDDPSRLLEAAAGAAAGMTVSERLRLVQRLIVGPASDGCAGVAESADVAVLALHDRAFNRQWLRHWSSKWLIDRSDLKRIREHFGEEIAMYFAFLQSYLLWLAFPSAFGAAWWALGRGFSWQLGVLLVLWSVLFTETWARRESDIATYWGVHGVQHARLSRRAGFRPDRHVADPATGDLVPYFSNATRWLRRLVGVPIVGALALLMAVFIAAIFALQTFLAEYYDGPLASLLGLAPVVLFSACLPAYTALCTRVAAALTEYENYEYEADHAAQFTAKIFVFRFLQDQLYLFLTAWVFVPHRDAFDAWLHAAFRALRELPPWLMPPLATTGTSESANAAYAGLKASSTPATVMVRDLLASFVVTSQIVGMVTETGLPLLLRWWNARSLAKASRATGTAAAAAAPGEAGPPLRPRGGQRALASVLALDPAGVDQWVESVAADVAASADAPPDLEQQFVARVAEETGLPEYSTYEDYAEMASQFARVAFFSVAWPLAPLAALLNNWLELRTDAAKICSATRRPVPRRVETIGPWLDILRFTCWLSSITNALLIYQFHPDCALLPAVADPAAMLRYGRTSLSFALVVLLFSEHAFLTIRWLIAHVMESWPGAYARITGRAHAQSKRRWLERAPAALHDAAAAAATADDDDSSDGDGVAAGSNGWRAELERGRQAIAAAYKAE